MPRENRHSHTSNTLYVMVVKNYMIAGLFNIGFPFLIRKMQQIAIKNENKLLFFAPLRCMDDMWPIYHYRVQLCSSKCSTTGPNNTKGMFVLSYKGIVHTYSFHSLMYHKCLLSSCK